MPVLVHPSRSCRGISNQAAAQHIKDLAKSCRHGDNSEIIQTAFQIYGQITEPRNHRPINALLTLCTKLKAQCPLNKIWDDIQSIRSGLNIPLLFRCCVEAKCTAQSVAVLKWMNSPHFQFQGHDSKDHSKAMVKLITNNKKDHSFIQQIHALIEWECLDDDIFMKSALINAYGECHDLQSARNIFALIPSEKMDSITIGVWMKALLRNEQNEELLSLYDDHLALHNDVIHMFALKAAIKMNDYQTGQRVIDHLKDREQSMSNQLRNTMIQFQGHFGHIDAALTVFTEIALKSIADINVMLKSYLQNGYCSEALDLFHQHHESANDITFTFALKAALNLQDWTQCQSIHQMIFDRKKSKNSKYCDSLSIELRSTMIDSYGQNGDTAMAMHLFDGVDAAQHTMISVGAVMKAMNHNQHHHEVLKVFDKFNHFRNDVIYFYAIKACLGTDDLERGKQIHSEVVANGGIEHRGIKLINSLIDFYGHFGDIPCCDALFESVAVTQRDKLDFVSIGSMMNALVINGQNKKAIRLYDQYPTLIDDTSTALAVKACINDHDADNGLRIYHQLIGGNDSECRVNAVSKDWSVSLSNTLIDFFGEFGDGERAQQIFASIPEHKLDAVSIGTMMKCLVNHEMERRALSVYHDHVSLRDAVCHTMAIRACRNIGDYEGGMVIHRQSGSQLMDPDIPYFNALIDFYCCFGEIGRAKEVMEGIPSSKLNALSINMMMKALNENNAHFQTLQIYHRFTSLQNDRSHLYAIKACTATRDWNTGRAIHRMLKLADFDNVILKGALIEFYGESGDCDAAKQLFDGIKDDEKDTATLNAMIKCLSQSAHHWTEAIALYEEYSDLVDDISHAVMLKMSKTRNDQAIGLRIYQHFKESVHGDGHTLHRHLGNVLIDFFGHFGDIESAKALFEKMGLVEDISTVNSMISALSDNGYFEEALSLYDEYQVLHDDISHILVLGVCTKSGRFDRGRALCSGLKVHKMQSDHDSLSLSLRNTIIDFHGNCGAVDEAKEVFDSIPNSEKDIYTMGAMMNVYCSNQRENECIALFENLQTLNPKLRLNAVCVSNALKACTRRTAYHLGRSIHDELEKDESLRWMLRESEVEIALMNLYGKSGSLSECERVFETVRLEQADKYRTEIGIWNAMMHALGRNGDIERVKELMHCMLNETEMKGDVRTFVVVITACAHAGDVDGARTIWQEMEDEDGKVKYHRNVVTAIIDCHSRAGSLQEGYQVMREYYEHNGQTYDAEDVTMMMALLSGCKKHNEHQLAAVIHQEMKLHFKDNDQYMASASTLLAALLNGRKDERTGAHWETIICRGLPTRATTGIDEADACQTADVNLFFFLHQAQHKSMGF